MTTAFVLSGGANLGAVQVGMLQALADAGVRPDLLVGTSAGAVNAGYLAGHGTGRDAVDFLAGVWRSMHARTLFHPAARQAVGALVGRHPSMFGDSGLRGVLTRHLNFADLADAAIPVQVIATDLLTGAEVALDRGPAVEAILASCAIPGMLPPVTWTDGRVLVDGGLADNAAVSRAVDAGADRVYVLPCGYACALPRAPRTAWGALVQAMSVLVHQRLAQDIRLYEDRVDLIVLPPPCPLNVGPLDFGHADRLITAAHQSALSFLALDGGRRDRPAEQIGVHTHQVGA